LEINPGSKSPIESIAYETRKELNNPHLKIQLTLLTNTFATLGLNL